MSRPLRIYAAGMGRNGQRLDDVRNGRRLPWEHHKAFSLLLAQSYHRLSDTLPELLKQSVAIADCGSFLKFSCCPAGHPEASQLIGASFCRQRLCPMCQWRRSLLVSMQVAQVAHEAHVRTGCHFLMLTLTVRNTDSDGFDASMDAMLKAFNRFKQYAVVKKALLGFFRAFEVTISRQKGYHPHFHLLLAVRPTYFKKTYIKQQTWTDLWRKALQVDYQPIVDVRKVKAQTGKGLEGAAAEVAKYAVKPGDFIDTEDWDFTDSNVDTLHHTLKGRRGYAYGGLLKKVYTDLFGVVDLEADDADLVAADIERCTCPVCQSDLQQQVYRWFQDDQFYYS